MNSPLRVAFGLRSYATDSESGSWSGSELSPFPSDSDADSLCTDLPCEGDLPGIEVDSTNSGITPKGDARDAQNKHLFVTNPSHPPKESWSEIDEKARLSQGQQQKPMIKRTEGEPRTRTRFSGGSGSSHKRGDHKPTNADLSSSWRSKTYPKRRTERKRPDRRRPRSDPPLKGAVVRPYTLPSGPITVLRRPTSDAHDTSDPEKVKLPDTSELEHLGFIEDGANASGHDTKENNRASCAAPAGTNARVVTTRFGEGFLVENPRSEKQTRGDSKSTGAELVARNAAMTAMAGLSMGSRGGKERSRSMDSSMSAETYDRSLGGHYKPPPAGRRQSKRSKEKSASSGGWGDHPNHGPRPRPNVFIGRRPKLEARHVREDDFLLGE